MKKRRRIEITAFRRRTTIILREPVGDNFSAPPPDRGDALQRVLSDLTTKDVDLDLDQFTQATRINPTPLKLSESKETGNPPNPEAEEGIED